MPASNDLAEVRRLAATEATCILTRVVLESLASFSLDTDDLRAILEFDLGETHWFKSRITERVFVPSVSDYFSIWVDECAARMFVKLLIMETDRGRRLVITSFKKDDRYV